MAEQCVDRYTRRVASDIWTRPFFYDSCLTNFHCIVTGPIVVDSLLSGVNWQSLTHAAVHTSVSCATVWMDGWKMQVALLAEPKTPLESSVFYYEH